MSLLDEETVNDFELARKVITEKNLSYVVISCGKIWKESQNNSISSLIGIIDGMGKDLTNMIIGTSYLDRASSLLCRYAKASGVYSPSGTKTAIAILIMGGVPCQIDRLDRNNVETSFDKIVNGVENPVDAYNILKEKI